MENLPQDPFMLMSFINMKLRDKYANLDALCDDLEIDKSALKEKLSVVGFEYNEETNKFW